MPHLAMHSRVSVCSLLQTFQEFYAHNVQCHSTEYQITLVLPGPVSYPSLLHQAHITDVLSCMLQRPDTSLKLPV